MDNNYHYLSARMSDGRFLTDYSPNCDMNRKYQGNMTSWQYRMFLTNNTSLILDNKTGECVDCKGNAPVNPRYRQTCSKDGNCMVDEINPNGIGLE